MKRIGYLTLACAAVVSLALADDTGSNRGLRTGRGGTVRVAVNTAETGLVGIKLYDTGLTLVQRFGSPDEILNVTATGGGAIGPAGGGAATGGRGGPQGGGGSGGGAAQDIQWNVPGLDWQPINVQGGRAAGQDGRSDAPGGGPPQIGGAGGGGAGGGGGAAGGAAAGAGDRVVYTRWVYHRGNSRYAFILNRYNQVIQIEAIGSNDPRVYTSRGIRYGSQFADIIKRYGAPDGYEISGNTLVVRYLVRNKVAFRMNRLRDDAKHVVTGIVVAAGKI